MKIDSDVSACSFTELAMRYNPAMSVRGARRVLREWVNLNTGLSSGLTDSGWTVGVRMLSPRQVEMFYHYLGEP